MNGQSITTPAFAYDAGWELTTSAVRKYMSRQKLADAFANIAIAETSTSTTYDVLWTQFYSDTLKAQTISGTIKSMFRCLETSAGLMCAQMSVRVISQTGTVRGTAITMSTAVLSSEFDAVTLTNRKFPLAASWGGAGAPLTSVVAQDDDRLVVEVGYRATNSTATSKTGTVELGTNKAADLAEDETSTTQNAPWIEFSQDLLFTSDSGANAGSKAVGGLANLNGVKYVGRSSPSQYTINGTTPISTWQDFGRSIVRPTCNPMMTPQQGMVLPPVIPSSTHTTTTYYRMRGYRYMHLPVHDFEEWTATGAPNTSNPSLEPITDVVIIASWTV